MEAPPIKPLSELEDQTHKALLQEHSILHQKMSQAVEHLIRIEIYILVAIGAIYAWIFGADTLVDNGNSELQKVALLVPFLMAAITTYRSFMQIEYIKAIGEYLKKVEVALFAKAPVVGWENFYPPDSIKKWNTTYRILFWPSILIVTIVLALPGIESLLDYLHEMAKKPE